MEQNTNYRLNSLCRLEFHLKDMFGRFVKVIMPNVPDSVCQSLQLKFHGMPIRYSVVPTAWMIWITLFQRKDYKE